MSRPFVLVVAAALYDAHGRVLIAQRPAGKALAGRWEFPGGKVNGRESEYGALVRELDEELGIGVSEATPCMRLTHAYADRDVELSLWQVTHYQGDPQPREGQQLKWVEPRRLHEEDILEADQPFIEVLYNPSSTTS
ncbi:MAG: (deoxy)nucleoside triphosphate pyrophosphohydrolase [Proteobacteria bacterium]|nr:(deoxy)nucleoside triphosphate pyrophosphohydrolase [Pseudomonadota bacterium]